MTILELYEWAVENDALDIDIEVYDSTGCTTEYIQPEITEYSNYKVIQL